MFIFNYTAVDYLLLILLLLLLVLVTVLRNSFLSILRSVRQAKTKRSNLTGDTQRNASTVNDDGKTATKLDLQIYRRDQPNAKGEPPTAFG